MDEREKAAVQKRQEAQAAFKLAKQLERDLERMTAEMHEAWQRFHALSDEAIRLGGPATRKNAQAVELASLEKAIEELTK